MTYQKQFVAVIKHNGKILREVDGETVHLPYGSEYSIFLKNLESRTALVKISIDGTKIGKDLIIRGNSELEVERFIEDLNEGNKFKFIQKTEQIIKHRGDKIDDGFIRIEFAFEKTKPITVDIHEVIHTSYPWRQIPYPFYSYPLVYSSPSLQQDRGIKIGFSNNVSAMNMMTAANICCNTSPNQDEGITVKGSPSNQQFHYGSIGELEPNSYVITLRLKGYFEKGKMKIVTTPITTKTKIGCPTCGKKNKSNIKYCAECGTYLW